MTSHIISAHTDRSAAASKAWTPYPTDPDACVFCRIIRGELAAHRVYSSPDDRAHAFLDILPIRPGHTLVVPTAHVSRLTDLEEDDAAALGRAVARVGKALTLAMDNTGLNVVCNQEYAQAVPHVHFHIVPAPILNAPIDVATLEVSQDLAQTSLDAKRASPLDHQTMLKLERNAREELDDDDGEVIAANIRSKL